MFMPANTIAGVSFNIICAFTYRAILAKLIAPRTRPAKIFLGCQFAWVMARYAIDKTNATMKMRFNVTANCRPRLLLYLSKISTAA